MVSTSLLSVVLTTPSRTGDKDSVKCKSAPSSSFQKSGNNSISTNTAKSNRKRNIKVHDHKHTVMTENQQHHQTQQQQQQQQHDDDEHHDHDCCATTSSSASAASASSFSSSTSTVSFGEVVVREYGMTLGVNPSCSLGAPVTLDWDYEQLMPVSVDDFEASKTDSGTEPGTRRRRSQPKQFYLSCCKRKDILEAAGYHEEDFNAGQRAIQKDRFHRKLSLYENYPLIMGRRIRRTFTQLKTKAFLIQYQRRTRIENKRTAKEEKQDQRKRLQQQ